MSDFIERAEGQIWIDSTGRKLEVGQVVTHAIRSGSYLGLKTGIIRELHDTCIDIDMWSWYTLDFSKSHIRVTEYTTITGMSEDDLHELLGRKTAPLTSLEPDEYAEVLEISAYEKEHFESMSLL